MFQLWSQQSLGLFFFTFCSIFPSISSSSSSKILCTGSSLSVERPHDVLLSSDATFSAGFVRIGDNAYCFAIWFTQAQEFTPVWMANRDVPVNGSRSTLTLQRDGNLILKDGGRSVIWATDTTSDSSLLLRLENTGNLILHTTTASEILWQSFDFPTDTLLPEQKLTRNSKLVSSRSRSNYSSGFYSLYFDNDNILRLLYNGPETSSVYWPVPWLVSWDAGRTTYNNSRIAVLDTVGQFLSSDDFQFITSDFGHGLKRRLTVDFDGNVRVYSLNAEKKSWDVSWQAISRPCSIRGLCGPNSVCLYTPERRCSCLPGYKMKDPSDFSLGCEPTFHLSCDANASSFFTLPYVDFYGYDLNYTENISFDDCKNICLQECSCKAFMYILDGQGRCYPKTSLLDGYRDGSPGGSMYFKVPKNYTISSENFIKGMELDCNHSKPPLQLHPTSTIKFLLWFTVALGGAQLVMILSGWCFIVVNDDMDKIRAGYLYSATGFKKFSYNELKKATRNFREEIGRGQTGVVYKGVLAEQGAAAIKRLEGFNQGEMEFRGEMSIIGKINHMNLIQMFGFCAEGKHRLLVYEYMDHGSLADNLTSSALGWDRRFDIAVGTAKGLAYLHEECLEWILHCDIKPQNILLDGDYNPKVADFGLSKLSDRHGVDRLSFSKVRGTRGHMAPEWILNLPITSKVDVYSYGIVVLEMVTGKRSMAFRGTDEEGSGDGKLVPWVSEVMGARNTSIVAKIEEIKDPKVSSIYDEGKMELLVRVALQCVEEDREARPTMSQVVEMLVGQRSRHKQSEERMEEVE